MTVAHFLLEQTTLTFIKFTRPKTKLSIIINHENNDKNDDIFHIKLFEIAMAVSHNYKKLVCLVVIKNKVNHFAHVLYKNNVIQKAKFEPGKEDEELLVQGH